MRSVLDELAAQMKQQSSMRIKITSYAGDPLGENKIARSVSLRRGLLVRAYLIEQGIDHERMNVSAKGNEDVGDGPKERIDISAE